MQAAATQNGDNLEIALSETDTLTLAGVTLAALTAETVTTLDEDDKDTTTPPADANSASEGRTLPPPEPQAAQSASEKLPPADPLGPPPALALFDADLDGYSAV